MKALFAKIRQWFRPRPPAPLHGPAIARLMQLAGDTPAVALSCDDIHLWVDVYADALQRGEDVSQLMPIVQMHLDMCPDCAEELQALLAMMAVSS
jgi:hypothetical protein